ncbi:MAG TPA: sulfotransferase [Actinomycetota bacterium]|nr:sulfotransferase [Actinomycetota bacterium]
MNADRGPIFVGGLAHSGKTQVRTVLGAHPELSMTRHTHLWDRYYGRFGDIGDPRNLERCLAAIGGDQRVAVLRPDLAQLRRELSEGRVPYARLFGLLHRQHAERSGKRRWGEQLRGVERFADPIFEEFPTARMIHMIRDPRAGTSHDPGRRLGALGWETARWITSAALAERNLRRYGGRYRVVRYETLATTPRDTVRELCAFLDEEYLPGMDHVLDSIRYDEDAPELGQRDEGRSSPSLAFIDRYAARDLRIFDYPVGSSGMTTTRERLAFALVARPVNCASMAAWHLLEGRSRVGRVKG